MAISIALAINASLKSLHFSDNLSILTTLRREWMREAKTLTQALANDISHLILR